MTGIKESHATTYLRRIGVQRPTKPDSPSLATLQLAHLRRVPFENLDIQRGVPIRLDPASAFEKVVNRNRGGYCYELNSAFGALLRELGYSVDIVSARVAREHGAFSPEFAHLALVVTAVDVPEPFLVDVGFGDGFTVPLPLVPDSESLDRDRMVRLSRSGPGWLYEEDRGDGWQSRYAFTLQPRHLHEFAAMNVWQQTSPDSHFTAGLICSLLTERGRDTISGNRLIVNEDGRRFERVIAPDDIASILFERFGVAV